MDIKTIRQALKDAVGTVDGLRVTDLRDDPNPPCAIIYPRAPFPLQETWDETVEPHFIVLVLVPYVNSQSAQDKLDSYLSDESNESIKKAIENDNTLGGVVSDCWVASLESYSVLSLTDGGTRYLSAEILVRVFS